MTCCSYPIAVCDNYRIKRSKTYHAEAFRGYIASKKRYLYNFGSFVTGDKAYNDYTIEDIMREAGVELTPLRKKNSLRPHLLI